MSCSTAVDSFFYCLADSSSAFFFVMWSLQLPFQFAWRDLLPFLRLVLSRCLGIFSQSVYLRAFMLVTFWFW
ncbi:hypothetical protein CPB84DRAFT_1770577 [Gymnopilus junonius]|uniref:Uncharacterized protein n=1 Tax=Gymnopilus junonius TaxID=109634 RepID=A0A9P5NT95_GYMJU|nr:hypothetical protein CPB84DRAFT_1770577 [Gymnopilus junonius]